MIQISIKTTPGADFGSQTSGVDSYRSLSGGTETQGGSADQLSSTLDKLADLLTALMFASKGQSDNTQSGLQTGGTGTKSGLSPIDTQNTEAVDKLFAKALENLLGSDTVNSLSQSGNSGALLSDSQATPANKAAYSQGVKDALTLLLGNNAGGSAGTSSSLSLGGNGLQGLSTTSDFTQLGNAVGSGVGKNAGLQALNNIDTHRDGVDRNFVNKEDRGTAKIIGQLMDQYPEIFGKPEYQKDNASSPVQDDKSWAQALSKPDDDGMTSESMDKFKQAVGMVKSVLGGDNGNTNLNLRGAGGSLLGIDAAVAGEKITHLSLSELTA
ncbi:type III secretion protein HrpN [Lonsdalea quercina]|uniref:HrpZ protein n=1 Tax=Lonsdalea quercina TaxID=71657 RepID=A0A1H3Y0F6_9GAMM|nr:type III secretion protein HrpN [Lonsdalea quercina]SEA05179.1 HrpZ protein [Lonsdalea quercina]